jgi:SERRATE/Ars2, N-terminal domain
MISDKNKSNIFVPGYDGPLLSLSLFNELQHNIFSTEKIENEYKLYKSKFENKRYQSFYVEHQNDEWFKEKYDPESNLKWKLEKNAQCQKLSQKFQEALRSGFYRDLKLRLLENDENNRNIKILCHVYNKEKDEFEEKERDLIISNKTKNETNYIDISNAPYFGFDPDKMTLFLHQLPRNVSRWHILDIIKKLPGFISMSLSEPIKNQNYYRYCWVTFDSEANCEMGYETLNEYRISNDYKIIPIKSKSSTVKRIRLTPALFDDRIEEDLEFSKLLMDLFDKEKNIEVK